jgi:hypothetical protein
VGAVAYAGDAAKPTMTAGCRSERRDLAAGAVVLAQPFKASTRERLVAAGDEAEHDLGQLLAQLVADGMVGEKVQRPIVGEPWRLQGGGASAHSQPAAYAQNATETWQ